MRRLGVLAVLVVCGCLRANTIDCGDLLCPPTTSCAPQFGRCVSSEAILACEGKDDGAACATTTGDGTCLGRVCIPHHCGDGVITAPEECDASNLAGSTCTTAGFYHEGPVACAPDCTLDVSGCTGTCGDGIVELHEACDGPTTETCQDLGFYEGDTVSCTTRCTFNTNACAKYCGDNVVNGNETCDGADPQLHCTSFGYDYGSTACTASCGANLSRCGRLGWRLDPVEFPSLLIGKVNVVAEWAYMGGPGGRIVRFNDVSSTTLQTGVDSTVTGVWGTSSSDLVAVTMGGHVVRFDGTNWTTEATLGIQLNSVHGVATDSIWAVGQGGAIWHYDGTTWSSVNDSGVTVGLNDVFAITPTDVVAVGNSGTILRFDGLNWASVNTIATTAALRAVWASGSADVHVGGVAVYLRWDGAWQSSPLPIAAGQPVWVTGLSASAVFVAQYSGTLERVWHYDGRTWAGLGFPPRGLAIQGLEVTSTGQLVMPGEVGPVSPAVWRFHQAGLAATSPSTSPSVSNFWSTGRDFVVGAGTFSGSNKVLTVFDGTAWTNTSLGSGWLADVWGVDRDLFFVVGSPNAVHRYDRGTWQAEAHGASLGVAHGIWGTSATDVFVVGSTGAAHLGPGGWTAQTLPTGTPALFDVWGTSSSNVYAVGNNGTILRYDGASWQAQASGTQVQLRRLWGTSPTNIYALGAQLLLHYDGTSWSQVDLGTNALLVSISGSGPDDVFVLTLNNTLVHWDGHRWAPVDLGLLPQDTIPAAIYADRDQWLFAGLEGFIAPGTAMIRHYLRPGPGGIGK